jgi:RNA-directed DNA polymerase
VIRSDTTLPALTHAIARSFLAGKFRTGKEGARETYARAARTLGKDWHWLRRLSLRYAKAFEVRPRHRDVVDFLRRDGRIERAFRLYEGQFRITNWIDQAVGMRTVEQTDAWKLPAIHNPTELADFLCLGVSELEWLADYKGINSKAQSTKLHHYNYWLRAKRSGGVRVIEVPKLRLKDAQRRILDDILACVPPHSTVHGFVRGRSIVSFAQPHANQALVIRMDLADFFPSVDRARVEGIFRNLGYGDLVARLLAGLCTSRVPAPVLAHASIEVDREERQRARLLYGVPHLPQGAPTSPALANLCAYNLDCRLAGLARSAGATYTRYADDLAFSGGEEFCRGASRFVDHVAAIALEEGFAVNHRKTRLHRQGARQKLAGVVVNRQPGVTREDRELLEAILFNCVRYGPSSQNRKGLPDFRSHLQGRVSHVRMVNSGHAERLHQLFEAIDWTR